MQKRILIIDDDPQVLKFLSNVLKKNIYQIETALDAKQALFKIKAKKPDIIISDTIMPGMDGFEFIETLKKNPETHNIPFIYISGKKDPADELKGLHIGEQECIIKPFEVPTLAAAVKNLLDKVKIHARPVKPADFKGNLAKMGLEDIIQNAEINQKTGELVFSTLDENIRIGSLFFKKGRLVHAVSNVLQGEEAFYDLASINKGYFKFFSSERRIPETISAQTIELMFEAGRMRDEANALYKILDDTDTSLEIQSTRIPDDIVDAIGIKWIKKIIDMIREEKTVRDIIHSGQMSRVRAEGAVSGLLYAKVIKASSQIMESRGSDKNRTAERATAKKSRKLSFPFYKTIEKITDTPGKIKKNKMRYLAFSIPLIFILTVSGLILFFIGKPQGKVEITQQTFSIRKLSSYGYTIDARGKIKNIGKVDLKNIVVTGRCETCAIGMAPGRWTIVEESQRKRSAQEEDVIKYLAAGDEADFSFTDVAVIYNTVPEEPKELPMQLEAVVESFETAD